MLECVQCNYRGRIVSLLYTRAGELVLHMGKYFLNILGIILSVAFFIISYKRTINAKNERIWAANSEVVRILIRLIVLEKYRPTEKDMFRLIEGKAREFKVKEGELLSPLSILNVVYTKIAETDFITREQREEILGNILESIDGIEDSEENAGEGGIDFALASTIESQEKKRDVFRVLLGLVAAIMGSFLALIPEVMRMHVAGWDAYRFYSGFLITMVVSLAAIGMVSVFQRFKEEQVDVSSSSTARFTRATEFELAVRKLLIKKFGESKVLVSKDKGYDFQVEASQGKIFIEVKAWDHQVPNRIISRVVNILDSVVRENGGREGLLIAAYPLKYAMEALGDKNVKVMDLKGLEKYF